MADDLRSDLVPEDDLPALDDEDGRRLRTRRVTAPPAPPVAEPEGGRDGAAALLERDDLTRARQASVPLDGLHMGVERLGDAALDDDGVPGEERRRPLVVVHLEGIAPRVDDAS